MKAALRIGSGAGCEGDPTFDAEAVLETAPQERNSHFLPSEAQMFISFRNSLLALATVATVLGAAAAAPAAAYDGRPDGYRREEPRGWDHRVDRHRPRCWMETRRVRVMTPWGPRMRTQETRVCR